jgi:hypothetical protein
MHLWNFSVIKMLSYLMRSIPCPMLKADCGHSSNVVGVELCLRAGAHRLVMLHHDPMLDDFRLEAIQGESRRLAELISGGRALRVTSAYDGLELTI